MNFILDKEEKEGCLEELEVPNQTCNPLTLEASTIWWEMIRLPRILTDLEIIQELKLQFQ
tara:strand:- start:792 stop:971 length:180 start_codon:yes stop_codon:yes gene_type:complete